MHNIPKLPFAYNFDTITILKKLARAHRALAELKGISEIIPNQGILINTLALQEAKDSSAIENIITTSDELFQSDVKRQSFSTKAAKEVYNYVEALKRGYEAIQKNGLLTNNLIIEIQALIEKNSAGFRTIPGTELKNESTGEIVYLPPQDAIEIAKLMNNLECYLNDNSLCGNDPLIKMAIIHHQFESIHPFFDGNGRTGRIINVLYLVKSSLLKAPVLYLSRFINQNKNEYYRLLQAVREDSKNWESWVLFFLDGIIQTSEQTINLIRDIQKVLLHQKNTIRFQLPKIYSQELLNNLFHHPYTKVEFVEEELGIHRNTARKYLTELSNIGILTKHKISKENFYINSELFMLLQNINYSK